MYNFLAPDVLDQEQSVALAQTSVPDLALIAQELRYLFTQTLTR